MEVSVNTRSSVRLVEPTIVFECFQLYMGTWRDFTWWCWMVKYREWFRCNFFFFLLKWGKKKNKSRIENDDRLIKQNELKVFNRYSWAIWNVTEWWNTEQISQIFQIPQITVYDSKASDARLRFNLFALDNHEISNIVSFARYRKCFSRKTWKSFVVGNLPRRQLFVVR